MSWIQTLRVGEMEMSRGWDVESEALVVIGCRTQVVTIGCVGGPGCMCCWVVINECSGSKWGKRSLVEIEAAVDFLVG